MGWMRCCPNAAHARVYAHLAAVALGFAFITYMHVVVGELVPKSLALRRAEALAVAVAPPMLVFMALARPAVRLLRNSAAVVLRGFDVPMTDRAAVHSPEELKLIATAARRMGLLPPFQETLVHRALELDDVSIREIMTPRQKIFSLPSNMPVEEASANASSTANTLACRSTTRRRGPGAHCGRGLFQGPGAADVLSAWNQSPNRWGAAPEIRNSACGHRARLSQHSEDSLSQVMRDVLVVPETKTVLDLIRDFQQRRRHMAIVVDEYGSTVGLVTAEDAIEQLTGELEDEFDDPARPMLSTASGALLMDGGVNLRDLETQMQWSLPRDGGVETLAGFLLMRLGHIPEAGESVDL